MAKIRVHRIITAKPGCLQDLMRINFEACKVIQQKTGISPDVFCSRFAPKSIGSQHIYMDLDSFAQYEKLFIDGMLFETEYLKIASKANDLIIEQPIDELMVRLSDDDFFMKANLK